ncbi:MAG: cell envelope integrity protein TolA [Desulfobulbus sp.]|uniref:cell envelope integrity protein TolA n=1 Tax=Desulfobulbus sp. TaxID=895 RepID=UPI00284A0707|nr:cell envelope integrity protein TolA [Desulfobulbus sp.]MDR2550571.1 cell envelope integrity protein TolA [Desulfobulbus sp.]
MQYSETEFHLLQQEAEQRWWLAFVLALCVHGAVVVTMVLMPSLFESKPIVEEVVSVSLVAMPDVGGAPAAPAPPAAAGPPPKPAAEKVEPPPPPPPPPKPAAPPEPATPPEQLAPTPKEKVAVQPEVAPPEPVDLKNPISLAPDKRKIKKNPDTRLEEEKVKEREQEQRKQEERELQKKLEERKREAEQRKQEERELQKKLEERKREAEQRKQEERQKALAQARLEQIKAENEARAAAAEARELAAQANAARDAAAAVRADANRRSQAMQNAVSGGSASGRQQAVSIVEQTYWGAVAQRVKSFWVLPEMRKWDSSLLAMVVITINKNGEVTRIQFDQRSKDPLFDQLVEKTIRSAAPLPRFPALMQQETTEVGFKFRPGELGNM